jgi:hypothetical protein
MGLREGWYYGNWLSTWDLWCLAVVCRYHFQTMKLIFAALLTASLLCLPIFAKTVRGYTKKNGTVVQPHQRTKGNRTETDNYSSKGNQNPYTGKKGSKKAAR